MEIKSMFKSQCLSGKMSSILITHWPSKKDRVRLNLLTFQVNINTAYTRQLSTAFIHLLILCENCLLLNGKQERKTRFIKYVC